MDTFSDFEYEFKSLPTSVRSVSVDEISDQPAKLDTVGSTKAVEQNHILQEEENLSTQINNKQDLAQAIRRKTQELLRENEVRQKDSFDLDSSNLQLANYHKKTSDFVTENRLREGSSVYSPTPIKQKPPRSNSSITDSKYHHLSHRSPTGHTKEKLNKHFSLKSVKSSENFKPKVISLVRKSNSVIHTPDSPPYSTKSSSKRQHIPITHVTPHTLTPNTKLVVRKDPRLHPTFPLNTTFYPDTYTSQELTRSNSKKLNRLYRPVYSSSVNINLGSPRVRNSTYFETRSNQTESILEEDLVENTGRFCRFKGDFR